MLLFLLLYSGTPGPNESQQIQRSAHRFPFIPGSERVKILHFNSRVETITFKFAVRIYGDERPTQPSASSDLADLTDGGLVMMKAPRQPAPSGARKTRPPPKFDMAAELLMSGGREREPQPIKLNNNYGRMMSAGVDETTEADRLMQRLNAL